MKPNCEPLNFLSNDEIASLTIISAVKKCVAEIILAMMFKAMMSMATLWDIVSMGPGLHKAGMGLVM